MGIFDKIFGQSNKIKVQFIDNFNGETIGVAEMEPNQLPETFEVATTMHIQNVDWSVEEAIPVKAIDFIKTKQLILKMRKIEYMNPKDILYTLPTISNELPATITDTKFNDFELTILEDDWRQTEFLNISSFPLMDIEIEKIKSIWINHKKEVDAPFNAFDKLHVRDTIGEPGLNIDFNKLKELLNADNAGNLKFDRVAGFVKNGFSIKTSSTTYYGILENHTVTHLCIYKPSETTINEISQICNEFNLVFIDWYHADIISK